MSAPRKLYLGDSVYAEVDPDGRIVLTTDNGYPDDPRNRIVMEPEVLDALEKWIARLRADVDRAAQDAAITAAGLDPKDPAAPRHTLD